MRGWEGGGNEGGVMGGVACVRKEGERKGRRVERGEENIDVSAGRGDSGGGWLRTGVDGRGEEEIGEGKCKVR